MDQIQQDFGSAASESTLQRVADRIRERNIEVLIVNSAKEARQIVIGRIPKDAEVHYGKSTTLQDSGIFDALRYPKHCDVLRYQFLEKDCRTRVHEIWKLLGAAPNFLLGSVQAITEDGVLVLVDVSATGSQIGAYTNTADKVIFVIGSQKIVPNLAMAFKRISEYIHPWEEARLQKLASEGNLVGQILLIERELINQRMTIVMVREPIGI